jgi:nucleotide-binding universal stress UspA family protein
MVLVAYDGSPASKRALDHAARLVGGGGELAVVNVIALTQSVSARLERVTDAQRHEQGRVLREARASLARRGIKAQIIRAVGDLTAEVLKAAETTNATTVVVGREPRRHLAHRTLSSTLVQQTDRDVLVVH